MRGVLVGLVAGAWLTLPAVASADVWEPIAGTPPPSATSYIQPDEFRAYALDAGALENRLDARARTATTTLTIPAPDGRLQRFAVSEAPIMEPSLAARHPEITTWSGRGIDDPAATIRADRTPLGFHASVRSPRGAWYIDPYHHLDDRVYITYYGRDLSHDPHGGLVEQELDEDTDPLALAVPQGPEVIRRTYRLAMVTDPSYATFFGGPQNVTAAKVTLMNRVNQIYEDETAIRLVLIDDGDRLNLHMAAMMTGPNGPCGAAPCYVTPPSCTGATLQRTRIVIGQLVGASNYDIGHIALGVDGGGVANVGVGGNIKAQGCTGLETPIGDFFAVDYVAHEMGHQFSASHTFNGVLVNCAGGNRSATNSVEPGSGSSIMAYAGICGQDNLQPHSDPYWSHRSYDQITTYVTSDQPPINEVQTVSLRAFDAFRLRLDGAESRPIVRGDNYTLQGITDAVNGNEVQTVATGAGPFTLGYLGAESPPIVPGQNDTPLGIQNAIMGGNEQQVVTLTGYTPATHSFRIQIGGATSALFGMGGLTVTNNNVAAAVNAIPGFPGTVTSSGAGSGGFTLTFAGASAGVDVPPVEIVGCACTATVRQTANGGPPLPTWPAGATVAAGPITATGFTLSLGGTLAGTDVAELTVSNGIVTETVEGAPAMLPPGATVTVAAYGGTGPLTDVGFQLTFGGTLANVDVAAVELLGADGFVGETARGGPIDNKGHLIEPTGNHAPVVTVPGPFTIPMRTPFALTGEATDSDGDTITYMWEQNDRGGLSGGSTAGTALGSNVKTNGPLFRQFGRAVDISPEDTLLSPSPGLNAVDTNPTRVFPDLDQIVAGNTNAATGTCPAMPPGTPVPMAFRECFSEFLPTADYVGFNLDRTLTFRLTARDGNPGAGGIGSAQTRVTVDPAAGPFLVTSHAAPATLRGGTAQTVTWDVAGTDAGPVNASEVRISLLSGEVLAARTPNDGSETVTLPNVAAERARIKVEAVGNVFFDLSDADQAILAAPAVSVTDPTVQYSDAVAPAVVVEATDADTAGSALTATATGLPAGLSLAVLSTSEHGRRWTLAGNVTAAPGSYAGSVTVTDGHGEAITRPLTVTVTPEDAVVTYVGDTLSSGKVLLRARLKDADDGAPGDIAKATVTFKRGTATLCTGSLSCTVTLPNGTHAITVEVGGHYRGSADATVRVAKPNRKLSAIGHLSGLSSVFAIDNRFAEIVYTAGGRVFRISADDVESIGFSSDGRRAELRATADLWDHSRLFWPVRVARNVTLHVALSEISRGTIAYSLWDGDRLLHEQPERALAGGFVTIR